MRWRLAPAGIVQILPEQKSPNMYCPTSGARRCRGRRSRRSRRSCRRRGRTPGPADDLAVLLQPLDGPVAVPALHDAPAVVGAAAAGRLSRCLLAVDLLVPVLADVADPQVAGGAIERERHGLRRPHAQISSRPALPTHGLWPGCGTGASPTVPLMSMRRILPSRRSLFWASVAPGRRCRRHRRCRCTGSRRGRRRCMPPLWLLFGWLDGQDPSARWSRSAMLGLLIEAWYSLIDVSPPLRVKLT